MAETARVTAVIEAQDKASGVLKNITGGFNGFSSAGLMAGAAVATVASGLVAFIGSSLKAAATMEQNQVAFTTMLGSAEKANVLIKDLTKFARATPFELTGLNTATKQLLAYGIAQEDIIPDLTSLGNIAAGVGMDKLPNLIMAFGQVKAATHLTGMELRQFTEAGVPLLDALAQQFKKTVPEIQKMVSAGDIGFPAVQKALESLSGEGGRFNGLMEAQSHTLSGMISNLGDAWNSFLIGSGAHFIDWAKQLVGLGTTILQWMSDFGGNISRMSDRIEESTGLISLFKMQWDSIVMTFRERLLPSLQQLWEALQPLMPFFKAMGQILGVVVIGTIVLLTQVITGLINQLAETITMGTNVATFFATIWSKTIGFVIDQVANLIVQIKEAVSWISKLSLGGIGGGIGKAIGAVGNILGFAEGGIVPGPVNAPQLAVVHGGERVIPVGGGGGAMTVNITGNTISSNLDVRDIARQVSEEMMRTLRQTQQV